MGITKETYGESFEEAGLPQAAGATQIELCADLPGGGTTPSYEAIKKRFKKLKAGDGIVKGILLAPVKF